MTISNCNLICVICPRKITHVYLSCRTIREYCNIFVWMFTQARRCIISLIYFLWLLWNISLSRIQNLKSILYIQQVDCVWKINIRYKCMHRFMHENFTYLKKKTHQIFSTVPYFQSMTIHFLDYLCHLGVVCSYFGTHYFKYMKCISMCHCLMF